MTISEQTIQSLKEEGYNVTFYEKDTFNDLPPEEATEILITNFDTPGAFVVESIKTPKKKEVTIEWVMSKLHKQSKFINLSNMVSKLINKPGMSVYPTSYGIGVSVLFAQKFEETEVSKILDRYDIEYTTEFSNARWVFRYKISKAAANIEKLKQITSTVTL